jgi:hypothetical protein
VSQEKLKNIDEDISWTKKSTIKKQLDTDRKIECTIKDVSITRGCAYLKLWLERFNVRKTIALDAALSTGSESEFEKLLKHKGISPIEDDIEDKLTDLTLYPEAKMKNGELIINNKSSYKKTDTEHNTDVNLLQIIFEALAGLMLAACVLLFGIYYPTYLIATVCIALSTLFVKNFGAM